MESSASKVTPSVFTTLENGIDASPTERQSTGTVSLLDDGPQRSTSVFCSLSFNLFFVIHISDENLLEMRLITLIVIE